MAKQQPFVLLVEDDTRLRNILARNLQAVGYMVFQAATFREAVDQAMRTPEGTTIICPPIPLSRTLPSQMNAKVACIASATW